MDDVVGGAGPLRNHQRLIETLAADRILDPIIFGITAMPRVAFVGLDFGDLEHQGC